MRPLRRPRVSLNFTMSHDGFGDVDWEAEFGHALDLTSEAGTVSTDVTDASWPHSTGSSIAGIDYASERVIPIRPPALRLTSFLDLWFALLPPESLEVWRYWAEFLTWTLYGRRNLTRELKAEAELTPMEVRVYQYIRTELQRYPGRLARIRQFTSRPDVTARLVNYFVVTYLVTERPLSYYLDRSRLPYRQVGQWNVRDQPELMTQPHVVWINLHQAYRNSKREFPFRNMHSPYKRGTVVRGPDGEEYALCEINFYLWMDDVGGFDAFDHCLPDIVAKKARYNEERRLADTHRANNTIIGRRRKPKMVLRRTNGDNYKCQLAQAPCTFPSRQPPTATLPWTSLINAPRHDTHCD